MDLASRSLVPECSNLDNKEGDGQPGGKGIFESIGDWFNNLPLGKKKENSVSNLRDINEAYGDSNFQHPAEDQDDDLPQGDEAEFEGLEPHNEKQKRLERRISYGYSDKIDDEDYGLKRRRPSLDSSELEGAFRTEDLESFIDDVVDVEIESDAKDLCALLICSGDEDDDSRPLDREYPEFAQAVSPKTKHYSGMGLQSVNRNFDATGYNPSLHDLEYVEESSCSLTCEHSTIGEINFKDSHPDSISEIVDLDYAPTLDRFARFGGSPD